MVRPPDYYEVLEVDPRAEPDVIRAAYRIQAQRFHPDRPTGSVRRMVALNQAWDVLGHPDRRASYDRVRAAHEAVPKAGAARERAAPGTTTENSAPASKSSQAAPTQEGPLARRQNAKEPRSSILSFGRYVGWSIAGVATTDPGYLEWLVTTPAGRPFADEVHRLLAKRGGAGLG